MVRFLLEAGADQEHKTDEMHTALMEACMVTSFYVHSLVGTSSDVCVGLLNCYSCGCLV